MISWTIPVVGGLTGLTSCTQSKSSSFTRSGGGAQSDFTASNRTEYRDFVTGKSYTSFNLSGATTYQMFSSSFSSSWITSTNQSAIIGSGTDTSNTSYTASETFSTSQETLISGITTTLNNVTLAAQTSTTATDSYEFASTVLTTAETTAWTTREESSKIKFVITETQGTSVGQDYRTSPSTFETTTTNGTTNALGLTATILRASDEIIYHFAPSHSWDNYEAATNQAKSTNQLTINPVISTVQVPAITLINSLSTQNSTSITGNTSRSWVFPESQYSSNFVTTSATTVTETGINTQILPNETHTFTKTKATTHISTLSARLWQSSSGSHRADNASTTLGSLWTTRHASPGSSWIGSLSWHCHRTTTVSTVFIRTIPIATNVVFVDFDYFQTTNAGDGLVEAGETSWRSESGQTQSKNTTVAYPPARRTAIAGETSAAKFCPKAARLGVLSGGWFSCNAATTFPFAAALDARPPLSTVMPTSLTFLENSTTKGVTYYGSGLTFSTQSGSSMTTTSTSLEVAGATTTTTMPLGGIGIFGGEPGHFETFANGVTVAGVYKDRIGGQTSVLLPGATTFSDARPVSKMTADTAITPPMGTGGSSRTTVYWTVSRNSSALPPVMPPNA